MQETKPRLANIVAMMVSSHRRACSGGGLTARGRGSSGKPRLPLRSCRGAPLRMVSLAFSNSSSSLVTCMDRLGLLAGHLDWPLDVVQVLLEHEQGRHTLGRKYAQEQTPVHDIFAKALMLSMFLLALAPVMIPSEALSVTSNTSSTAR